MKLTIILTISLVLLSVFAFMPNKHNIAGRWITYGDNGYIAYVDFTTDGTFKVVTPKGKLLHHGNYKLKDDVFSINDKEGCGDTYWGKYKFTFVGEDSIQTSLIEDSCTGRRQDLTTGNTGIKRMMKK